MANREGQRQEAFEAGQRNVLPGQAWVAALARGLQRELFGADMGTPAGQKVREELGSLGYEDALREGYPEDYAMGRAAGSDFVDPLTWMAMRGTPLRGAGNRLAGPRMAPQIGGGRVLEGEVLPAPMALPRPANGGGMRETAGRYTPTGGPARPMGDPQNGFERGTMSAYYRNTGGGEYGPYTPGARSGFAYKPEHSATYWEEGGQGFRPSIDDFVPLDVVRNDAQYFDRVAQEQAAALGRAGRHSEALHPIYGPNANRPNYGAAPEGYVSPIVRRGAPGVGARYEPIPGPAPFGQGSEGPGYFGNLPNPGVRSDIRGEVGTGAGMPRLRYDPVGSQDSRDLVPVGGRDLVATGGRDLANSPVRPIPNLPSMAQGRGVIPTELQGEFVEVPGIGFVPKNGSHAAWDGTLGGVTRDAAAPVGGGFPYGRAAAAGALGGAFGLGTLGGEDRQNGSAWSPSIHHDVGPMGFSGMYPLESNPLEIGTPAEQIRRRSVAAQPRKVVKSAQKGSPKVAQRDAPQNAPQNAPQTSWEPNINYLVTKALDELLGGNEAERGKAHTLYYANR